MEILLEDLEKCARAHAVLRQLPNKTADERAHMKALNRRIVAIKKKIPPTDLPDIPRVLPKKYSIEDRRLHRRGPQLFGREMKN